MVHHLTGSRPASSWVVAGRKTTRLRLPEQGGNKHNEGSMKSATAPSIHRILSTGRARGGGGGGGGGKLRIDKPATARATAATAATWGAMLRWQLKTENSKLKTYDERCRDGIPNS